MRSQHVPVLIVGAGPIGLCLSADLAWRGVPSMVVEQDDGRKRFARIMLIGVRTMEICRRLGVVEKVKNWGFPTDFPMDNVWVTSLCGYELGRGKVPSIGERQPFEFSPEFHGHCPQSYLEPILEELVRSSLGTNLRYRHKLESFVQDEDGVAAIVRNLETGQTEEVTADYLVGCDGFGSTTRKLLGIKMRGDQLIDYSYSIEFRVRDLASLHDKGNAGRYAVIGPEGTWATVLAVDGQETWRMLLYTVDEDIRQVDPASRVRRFIGCDCDFEVTDAQLWARRAVMADRFQDGRVFLAGDSGHTHVPNGGFGMNMGMADATNLGWKLAAVLQGWGHPNLLDSYDIERRPVCHRTMDEAKLELDRVTAETRYAEIADATPAGAAARAAFTDRIRKEYEGMRNWGVRAGIHLGHVYDPSPIVVADGTPAPEDDTWGYAPTSFPGARAPHAWLGENRSTLDLFERNFTLLRFGQRPADAQPLAAAAARRGVALDVHDIADPAIVALYERRLVLVRPDGHVAWRGDASPEEPLAVIDRVRGAGPRAAARLRMTGRQRMASLTP